MAYEPSSTRGNWRKDAVLPIRFRSEDLRIVRRAAARHGIEAGQWVRQCAFARIKKGGGQLEVTTGLGVMSIMLPVRLSAMDEDTLREAAVAEGLQLMTWLRAVALERARRVAA